MKGNGSVVQSGFGATYQLFALSNDAYQLVWPEYKVIYFWWRMLSW